VPAFISSTPRSRPEGDSVSEPESSSQLSATGSGFLGVPALAPLLPAGADGLRVSPERLEVIRREASVEAIVVQERVSQETVLGVEGSKDKDSRQQ
jgi:hypothetical protein